MREHQKEEEARKDQEVRSCPKCEVHDRAVITDVISQDPAATDSVQHGRSRPCDELAGDGHQERDVT